MENYCLDNYCSDNYCFTCTSDSDASDNEGNNNDEIFVNNYKLYTDLVRECDNNTEKRILKKQLKEFINEMDELSLEFKALRKRIEKKELKEKIKKIKIF